MRAHHIASVVLVFALAESTANADLLTDWTWDLDEGYFENVPLRDRSVNGDVGIAPDAAGDPIGIGFGGSQSPENSWVLEGLDTTSLEYANGGSPVLVEFVDHAGITLGGFGANVSRATGARIDLALRHGTNEFHGGAFAHIGLLVAPAVPVFTESTAIRAQNTPGSDGDAGVEVGGPIIKNHLWYWVGAASRMTSTRVTRIVGTHVDRRHNDGTIGAGDPNPGCELKGDCDSDNRADIDPKSGLPIFEEIERSHEFATTRMYDLAARIDGAIDPDEQGQLVLLATPTYLHTIGVNGTPRANDLNESTGTFDAVARWTSRLLDEALQLDVTAGWHHGWDGTSAIDQQAATSPVIQVVGSTLGNDGVGLNPDHAESTTVRHFCTDHDPTIHDDFPTITNCPIVGYAYGGAGTLYDKTQDRLTAHTSATYHLGDHRLSAGVDVEDDTAGISQGYTGKQFLEQFNSGTFWLVGEHAVQDPNGTSLCGTDPSGADIKCTVLDRVSAHVGDQRYSGWIEERWTIARWLTIAVGLRHELQVLGVARENQTQIDRATGKPVGATAVRLEDPLAPRVSVAWDPLHDGRSRVFASWDRLYESVPLDLNQRAFGTTDFTFQAYYACDPRMTGCVPVDSFGLLPSNQYLGGLVMPGLRPQHVDVATLGGELALEPDLRVGLTLQDRRIGDVIEDASTDGASTYVIANPGEALSASDARALEQQIAAESDPMRQATLKARLDMFRKLGSLDAPRRVHDAVTLSVRGRLGRVSLLGSYTYSRTIGNYPGLYSPNNGQLDPNLTSQFDLIELLSNRDGPLPQDHPHRLTLDGWTAIDLRHAGVLIIGGRLRAQSGSPIDVLGRHPLYGFNESFVLPRGAGGRTPFTGSADLRLGFRRGLITVTIDVFNLLDSQPTASVDQQYTIEYVNPIVGGTHDDLIHLKATSNTGIEENKPAQKSLTYGTTNQRYAPLTVRFGLRFDF
jgi:hypothetical protein